MIEPWPSLRAVGNSESAAGLGWRQVSLMYAYVLEFTLKGGVAVCLGRVYLERQDTGCTECWSVRVFYRGSHVRSG